MSLYSAPLCRLWVCSGSGLGVLYSMDILLDSGESRLHLLLYIRVLTQRSHPRRRREAGHLRQREREAGDFGKRNAR